MTQTRLTRRFALVAGASALLTPTILRAAPQDGAPMSARPAEIAAAQRQNVSSFRVIDWRDHFDALDRVTLIADTRSKALHYWAKDGTDYRLYPTSVPRSEELTKRGYTRIVRKRIGPDWTPTRSMIERNPELRYMPPGPDNPLGTHVMYLDWPAYLIHGTHDTRKIGRLSSDGCIGLYNEMIAELYALCPVGTQVKII